MNPQEWPPEDAVKELLKLLHSPNTPEARGILVDNLEKAKNLYQQTTADRRRIPLKAYDSVAKAANNLNAAMNRLNRYYHLRSDDWLTSREGAQAEVQRILTAADARVRMAKRGQPVKDNKLTVVILALHWLDGRDFLSRAARLSFIELYYETVTGESDARGKLDWQIRLLTGKRKAIGSAAGIGAGQAEGRTIIAATGHGSGKGRSRRRV
jgi:hypothetical protein